jgi:hypothetical protein
MILVAAPSGSDWALLDEERGQLLTIAGSLNAWAPRLAGGEGRWALPLNGRVAPVRAALSAAPAGLFDRVFGPAEPAAPGATLLAGVLGAPLTGRSNPLRSLCGYLAISRLDGASDWVMGPALVTRDEFGDGPPLLGPALGGQARDPVAHLRQTDAENDLRTGDIVVFGPYESDRRCFGRLAGCWATAEESPLRAERVGWRSEAPWWSNDIARGQRARSGNQTIRLRRRR